MKRQSVQFVKWISILVIGCSTPGLASAWTYYQGRFDGSAGRTTTSFFVGFESWTGICGLTRISGNFSGEANRKEIYLSPYSPWHITIVGGVDGQVSADVACDPYRRFTYVRAPTTESFWGYAYGFTDPATVRLWGDDSACILDDVGGQFDGYGEEVWTWDQLWWGNQYGNYLRVESRVDEDIPTFGGVRCHALCPGTYLTRSKYGVTQGEPDVRMEHSSTATCYLAGMRGKFRGGGEEIGIYVGGDGYYYLYAHSMQRDVAALAMCIPYRS